MFFDLISGCVSDRSFLEKTAKINDFGLSNPLQNTFQSHPKSMPKKHADFCYFGHEDHLSFKPSKPWKYQFSLRKITIFQVFAKMVCSNFGNFGLQKIIPKTMKNHIQTMKKSSLASTCFLTSIFTRLGVHFGSFWEALGSLLGGFGRPKWGPRSFRRRSRSSFYRALTQDGLQDVFWIDLGWLLERFGKVLGRI